MPAGRVTFSAQEPARLDWLKRPSSVKGDLPDVNVWLALAIEEHPHQAIAKAYWNALQVSPLAERNLWFCRVTMLGLVRLLSQLKVMGDRALNLAQAISVYQGFRAVPGVDLLSDADSTEQCFTNLIGHQDLPDRFCTDAYLAALSESTGARLVTFDEDFKRFELTNCLKLSSLCRGCCFNQSRFCTTISERFVIQMESVMLSVRLPAPLEKQLAEYCEAMQVTKSAAVQAALESHLKKKRPVIGVGVVAMKKENPFLTLVGKGNGRFSTEQIMRMTRGEDWNKP